MCTYIHAVDFFFFYSLFPASTFACLCITIRVIINRIFCICTRFAEACVYARACISLDKNIKLLSFARWTVHIIHFSPFGRQYRVDRYLHLLRHYLCLLNLITTNFAGVRASGAIQFGGQHSPSTLPQSWPIPLTLPTLSNKPRLVSKRYSKKYLRRQARW